MAGSLKVIAGTKPSAGEWERLISDHGAYLEHRGRRLRTIDHYSDVLKRVWLPWCEERGLEPTSVTYAELNGLKESLKARGLSDQSVKTYLTAINGFLAWCARPADQGGAQVDALKGLKAHAPSVKHRNIDILTRQEIDALEAAAETERDKLIVRVLGDTGIRLGELLRLRVTDLKANGRERYILVRGKGGAERLTPVTPGLHVRLDRYARRTRPESASETLFLTSRRGPRGDYEPLSEESVQHLLKYLGRKAGLSKNVHPHLLRHSFATHLLRRGVNPIQARDILGHTSLAMLDKFYSHLEPSDAYAAALRALQTTEDE